MRFKAKRQIQWALWWHTRISVLKSPKEEHIISSRLTTSFYFSSSSLFHRNVFLNLWIWNPHIIFPGENWWFPVSYVSSSTAYFTFYVLMIFPCLDGKCTWLIPSKRCIVPKRRRGLLMYGQIKGQVQWWNLRPRDVASSFLLGNTELGSLPWMLNETLKLLHQNMHNILRSFFFTLHHLVWNDFGFWCPRNFLAKMF